MEDNVIEIIYDSLVGYLDGHGRKKFRNRFKLSLRSVPEHLNNAAEKRIIVEFIHGGAQEIFCCYFRLNKANTELTSGTQRASPNNVFQLADPELLPKLLVEMEERVVFHRLRSSSIYVALDDATT